MRVYFCKKSEKQLNNKLNCQYFKRKLANAKDIDAKNVVLTEMFLLAFALENEKRDLNAVEISVNENGKPYFQGQNRDLFFNFSHSGEFVGVAVSSFEVGFDLQERKIVKESTLKFFNNQIKNGDFCESFCRFESFAKLMGVGIIKAKNLSKENVLYCCGSLGESKDYYYSTASYFEKSAEIKELVF